MYEHHVVVMKMTDLQIALYNPKLGPLDDINSRGLISAVFGDRELGYSPSLHLDPTEDAVNVVLGLTQDLQSFVEKRGDLLITLSEFSDTVCDMIKAQVPAAGESETATVLMNNVALVVEALIAPNFFQGSTPDKKVAVKASIAAAVKNYSSRFLLTENE